MALNISQFIKPLNGSPAGTTKGPSRIPSNVPSRLSEIPVSIPSIQEGSREATNTLPPTPAPAPNIPKIASAGYAVPREITAWNADGSSKHITLNDKQHEFASLVANRLSCVLIGAAGTGKTTCTQAGIQALMQSGNVLHIQDASHKYLKSGAPGILITAYTRRATQNIKRQMSKDISGNTITIHKALEFMPVFYEEMDEETGKLRRKREFQPKRTILNQLCPHIQTIIIDEASMLDYELYDKLRQATSPTCQWVFIGDLNQLPPVFGHAILGYKLLELPVIELTEVYRQALESPIIRLAHRVLSGQPIMSFDFPKFNDPGKVQIIPFPKQLPSEIAMLETCKMFYSGYDSGSWNPETDIILCPQTNDLSEKKYNCTLINKYLGNHIARKEMRTTYEIIAGFRKFYFSPGDLVIFDKQDATIVDIRQNDAYIGEDYQAPSIHLDYFGHNDHEQQRQLMNSDIDIDSLIEQSSFNIDEGAKLQCSHVVVIELADAHNDEIVRIELKTVGEMLALELAYAMTVHKSQGSEWRKVFLLMHNSHNHMINRELLYTAITRAKEQLVIICEKDSLSRGITKQKIKGDTLAEKAVFFKGKLPTTQTASTEE